LTRRPILRIGPPESGRRGAARRRVKGKPPGDEGVVLEWTIKWKARDPLNQMREIHRRERITILPDRMRIEDQTFGMTWIIRADLKKVWIIDRLRGELTELTFEAIRKRQKEIMDELTDAAARVPGTKDARWIKRILTGMGRHEKTPKVEVRTSDGERSVVLDGDRHLFRVKIDPKFKEGLAYFDLLAKIGAFPAPVAGKLASLGGMPVRGTLRFLFFSERITAEIETQSITRTEIPMGTFDPPKGLKKVPLRGFGRVPERKAKKPDFKEPNPEDKKDKP